MILLSLLEQHGLPVLTWNCFNNQTGRVLLLTTDHPDEVLCVLKEAGYRCWTNNVVLVGPMTYSPSLVAQLYMELKRDQVDIRSAYLSATQSGQSYVVFSTTNDLQAVRTIEQKQRPRRHSAETQAVASGLT